MWLKLKPISSGASIVEAVGASPTGASRIWVETNRQVDWDVVGSLFNPNFWRGDLPLLVSVVLIHYDDVPALRRCLAELERQTLSKDQFEVIVADDGTLPPAQDEMLGVICDHSRTMNVRLVVNPRGNNEGKVVRNCATISNIALAACLGGTVVRHSSHIIPCRPDCLSILVESPENKSGRVRGIMTDLPAQEPKGWTLEDMFNAIGSGRQVLTDLKPPTDSGISGDLERFYRGPGSVPLEAALRVGGFCQCFRNWGGEDDCFVRQLGMAGCAIASRKFMAKYVHLHHPFRSDAVASRSIKVYERVIKILGEKSIHELPESFYAL